MIEFPFKVEELVGQLVSRRRAFMRNRLFFAILSIVSVFINCAETGREKSTLGSNIPLQPPQSSSIEVQKIAPATEVVTAKSTSAIIEDAAAADTLTEDPEALIDTAKQQCIDSNFAAADSSLKRAVKAIESSNEDNGDNEGSLPASKYLADIIALYGKMPPPYSLPEDISMAAFQSQMVRSIDSLKFMPSDSLALIAKQCQKDLSYDVPMVWNQRVQRALFFYVKNRDVTIDRWFNRASFYLPTMRKMFADSALPLDLAYLPLIESGFNPLAYSYANASGIWQFISSTGKLYGLRHNFWIDERRDPLRSTQAAISYLKKLYAEFGNWHLALAAYNCGENGVSHAIQRKKTNDYWKLPLPCQTKNYVPFYLAAVTIAKNPKCFNLAMPAVEPFSLDTVLVNDCIVLSDIADGLGIPFDTLKKINPHIMRWCTPPDVPNTVLYLPKGQRCAFQDYYEKLPEDKKIKWCRFLVKPGDNIQKVAKQFNITEDCLAAINHLKKNNVVADHYLFVPPARDSLTTSVAYIPPESHDDDDFGDMLTYSVRRGDNLGKIARRFHVPLSQLYRLNRLTSSSTLRVGRVLVIHHPPAPSSETPAPVLAISTPPVPRQDTTTRQTAVYVVQTGDTPFSIAKRQGITLRDLVNGNSLDTAQPVIHVGDTLKLSVHQATIAGIRDSTPSDTIAPVRTGPLTDRTVSPIQPTISPDSGKPPLDRVAAQPADWSAAVSGPEDSASPSAKLDSRKNTVPSPHYYKIKKGDNLFRVSVAFSVPLPVLLTANNLTRNTIVHTGDSILIPKNPENRIKEKKTVYYKVRDGDTLLRIAANFGIPVEEIFKHNNLKSDSVLVPGEVIKVIKTGPL